MPGQGPPPKQNPLGHRRHRTVRQLRADGAVRGPELPADGPDGAGWHPLTREWWHSWRVCPQAQEFGGTDWSQLLDCAALHHLMWQQGRLELAGEVRLRAGKFGQTPADRLRLRITVEGAEH